MLSDELGPGKERYLTIIFTARHSSFIAQRLDFEEVSMIPLTIVPRTAPSRR